MTVHPSTLEAPLTPCGCGSEQFTVEYRTVARMTLTQGEPTKVVYGPLSHTDPYATATCTGCGAHLDIDNTTTPDAHAAALIDARDLANSYLPGIPSVTVKARPATVQVPVSEALRRHLPGY